VRSASNRPAARPWEDGLVKRTVFAEVPPRVEYELTAFGRSLEPVLLGLRDWVERYKRRFAT